MDRRALIIGASGYIGSHLKQDLLEAGWEVYGTHFRNPRGSQGESYFLDIRDPLSVHGCLSSVGPSVIFHLACDMGDIERTVVQGTENVLKARREVCSEGLFLFLSTDMVFDGEKAPYSEADTPLPITEYGRCKLEAEKMVLEEGGIVIRTSLVYGFAPLDPKTSLLREGLRTGVFAYPYFEDEIRSPIWVLDLCKALLKVAETPTAPPILHLAGPEPLNRYEMACLMADALGYSKSLVPPGSLGDSPLPRPRDLTLDISLAKRFLSFEPRVLKDVLSSIDLVEELQGCPR